MSGPHRLSGGATADAAPRRFRFNGREMTGRAGDTLASALLANGERLVGRSFKYHRPRGVFTAGSEEPNALVTLGAGAAAEPNTRATTVELVDGLEAFSQNHLGPLRWDALAVNDLLAPFLGAGFYYKTFMWPAAFWERVYEPAIRRAAGLGALSGAPDPDAYDKGFLHADLLVIGGGPAGLAAARTAARAGARVILAEEDARLGGRLNAETYAIDDAPGADWALAAADELAASPRVRVLTRAAVYAAFDHGVYGVLQRGSHPAAAPDGATPRQILWRVTARRAILAAGAIERSIAFPDNDRPGILLAGAARAYANRWDVACGRRVAVFTNNDDGWRTARDLAARGVAVEALLDTRADAEPPGGAPAGVEVVRGARVAGTRGRFGLSSLTLGDGRRLGVDALAVSGGWSPAIQLSCHHRDRPSWREEIAAFVPSDPPPGMRVAGAAAGLPTLAAALKDGAAAARAALADLDLPAAAEDAPPRAEDEPAEIQAFWRVEAPGRAWIDLQNDVTTKDVAQAHQEGFRSVEHLKRYTTLGMATDQGKTSNLLGLALLAEAEGRPIAEVGTTIFRPPTVPVAIGALAGRARGGAVRPTRRPPTHAWAEAAGAVFVEAGLWLRAQYFPQAGETYWRESVDREVQAVRRSVGVCDVSTLGKIDLKGRDAAAFLNHVYANAFSKLAIGRARYGLMLREDGFVMDDGTVARLGPLHYVLTTTTANAGRVMQHLEFCRQCLWPELDVHLQSVTDAWAQIALAGPEARALLGRIAAPDVDLSSEALPFMGCAAITLGDGTPTRIFRVSFSGELGYEIAVPARYGEALMRRLVGEGATPYGTEALGVMRIEKGHPAGPELDGRTTARDLGLDGLVSKKKDCVGKVLGARPELLREDRPRLVGLIPEAREDADLAAGAHLFADGAAQTLETSEGWVSSAAFSPTLGHRIALGFLAGGAARIGETVAAADPLRGRRTAVRVVAPCFLDPQGEKMRG